MPSYEALLILKCLPRPQLSSVIKRTATHIYRQNGLLLAIENWGAYALPHVMTAHGKKFREGSHFLYRFDSPITAIPVLKDEFKRDVDVIRGTVLPIKVPKPIECTLHEELKPPAYRQDVKDMIEKGRRRNIYVWKSNTGLDYVPFPT